jgi:dTDP-4-dehydrorhamnose 3,5-epimerase
LKITPTDLPEVLIIEPDVHRDDRGFFLETWHAGKYAALGLEARFVQDNHSRSTRGILRGLHAQLAHPQGKLIRCSLGELYDVAVDIRVGSPRFGQSVGVELAADDFRQLWIPEGFAHGFCVVSETAELQYKCTDLYDPSGEITVAWNDPALAIAWPVDAPLLSPKDAAGKLLADFTASELPTYTS